MEFEKCDLCGSEIFRIKSQSVNGGYTAYRICYRCGKEVEIIDTYQDN